MQTDPALSGTRISPTDVAQFIRLEQCERYLRLRLDERNVNSNVMGDYGVRAQAIPPLLTRSGAQFEAEIERAGGERRCSVRFSRHTEDGEERTDDNESVVEHALALPPGEVLMLFQPRLNVEVEGWLIRGDLDILRLHRHEDGSLHVLIADMKSSTSVKVEHRLQVAFYHEMIRSLFAEHGVGYSTLRLGILYRGPDGGAAASDEGETLRRAEQRALAADLFGAPGASLEIIENVQDYIDSVSDLVTAPRSTANRVAGAPFAEVPYHLTYRCDGCLYNEYCTKWSAQHDDLSLLPHITAGEKSALRRPLINIRTVRELAALKAPADDDPNHLVPAPGREATTRRISGARGVGPRLDELVHRARRYRANQGDAISALPYIPSKGYGSLPYSAPNHNPNLVRVYIDTQHDYLEDRIYMLGALVVGCERGEPVAHRRRSIVRLADGPLNTPERERELFAGWIRDTLRAIVEVAAPDADGRLRAPVHLIFYDSFDQRRLLEGLGRHLGALLGTTALYDFVTQIAAFDSPTVTHLESEIRELKNYPMLCQSLQAVARFLGFNWNEPEPYAGIFRARLFDDRGRLEIEGQTDPERPAWYTSRSRFNSQIPPEYAYVAWGELPPGERDDYAPYRRATKPLLEGFGARRLEAMEWIAQDFHGNDKTLKTPFELPDLSAFEDKARSLAHAIQEFVTIERHVELGDWKRARLAPPERRALSGHTLLARYHDADQDPDTRARNRENLRRYELRKRYEAEHKSMRPEADVELTPAQKEATKWDGGGMRVKLRLDVLGVDTDLQEAMDLSDLREGDRVIVYPRWVTDERLPQAERTPNQPTSKQLLYGARADLRSIQPDPDESGRAVSGVIEVEMVGSFAHLPPFMFGARGVRPFVDGELYTLDEDPNTISGYWHSKIITGILGGARNTLHDRLAGLSQGPVHWPDAARQGQERFLHGLVALHADGLLHDFEASKHEYIGRRGDTPALLVQGPPGTGKSYTTAWAVLARIQGAMAAGMPFRVLLSCKTHAATNVLLQQTVEVLEKLRRLREARPEYFGEGGYFDPRLTGEVALYRVHPREGQEWAAPVINLPKQPPKGAPGARTRLKKETWCVVAATPGGIYGIVKDKPFSSAFAECLVLDEASQTNLPEAILAALPLGPDGRLIVVGDPRQMPPIVHHDWGSEQRRTFGEYRTYESLYRTLEAAGVPSVKFSQSFRLHADMARFLKDEIYSKDGINYHSKLCGEGAVLRSSEHDDPFVTSVLLPRHPLVVIVHSEDGSQTRNRFERELLAPVIEALSRPPHSLDARDGLGVVVPHRDQRTEYQEHVPDLVVRDANGLVTLSAVDTVERFQGGERTAICVSATESDREYLLASSEFLLDPRRLTVAMSRARRKMVLVASRSVFTLFTAEEDAFANLQLWKNLLKRTCTTPLWQGERGGRRVEVWGNTPANPNY